MKHANRARIGALFIPITAAIIASAAPAGAAVSLAASGSSLVSCTGQETVNYNPPLTDTPKNTIVTINGKLGSGALDGLCTASGTGITSGTYSETFTRPGASCAQVAFNDPGSRVITWNDGTQSTFTFTAQIQTLPAASVVTLTGSITAGRFAGHATVETIQIPQPNALQCSTTGIGNSTDLATLVIS